jgi:hypothetical protein
MEKFHEPHAPEWLNQLCVRNIVQARMTSYVIKRFNSVNVCGICGDDDNVRDYIAKHNRFDDGTPVTARWCDDCHEIQSYMGDGLMMRTENDRT